MVETLAPYDKAIKDVKADLPKIARKILVDNKVKILKILKEDQLGKGIKSDGSEIGRYKPVTANFYAKQDPKPRKPKVAGALFNMEWSGGFFDKFDMMFEDEDSFTLFSRDSKAQLLEEEYGELVTLTEQNNDRVNNEILRPLLYDEMIKRLFA